MKKIKLDVPIEMTYYQEGHKKAAEIMAQMVEKTLARPEYRNELQRIVDTAVEETRADMNFINKQLSNS